MSMNARAPWLLGVLGTAALLVGLQAWFGHAPRAWLPQAASPSTAPAAQGAQGLLAGTGTASENPGNWRVLGIMSNVNTGAGKAAVLLAQEGQRPLVVSPGQENSAGLRLLDITASEVLIEASDGRQYRLPLPASMPAAGGIIPTPR